MFTKRNVSVNAPFVEIVSDSSNGDHYNRIWNMIDPKCRFCSMGTVESGYRGLLISPELILNELVRVTQENEELRSRIFKIKLALE